MYQGTDFRERVSVNVLRVLTFGERVSEAIDAIKTHEDLIKVIAMLQKINVAAYWDWQVNAKKTGILPHTQLHLLFSTKLK